MNRLAIIYFLLLSTLVGCGGGSSGTGVPDSFVGKVLTGSVVDETAAPVAGAKLTVAESGENTTTDSSGKFLLNSVVEGDISLIVDFDDMSSTVPIMTEDSTRSEVTITVNRRTGLANAKNLSVIAKILGRCDSAFENNAVIRQSNRLASGTACPVRVSVRRSGQGLSGIPFKVEHKKCEANAEWRQDLEGLTSLTGLGQGSFTFSTEPSSCDYRIVVAYGVTGVNEIIFPVSTFQRQAEDAGTIAK